MKFPSILFYICLLIEAWKQKKITRTILWLNVNSKMTFHLATSNLSFILFIQLVEEAHLQFYKKFPPGENCYVPAKKNMYIKTPKKYIHWLKPNTSHVYWPYKNECNSMSKWKKNTVYQMSHRLFPIFTIFLFVSIVLKLFQLLLLKIFHSV